MLLLGKINMDTGKMEGWVGKKVLITGINGFIGSHLARTLLDSGAVVHGISRKTTN